jgi:hypothetical protein
MSKYKPTEVIVVDATQRQEKRRKCVPNKKPFELKLLAAIKGSCRARNETITISAGDYIVFW